MAQIEMNPENEALLMAVMRIVACPADKRNHEAEQVIIDAIQELIDARKRVRVLETITNAQAETIVALTQRSVTSHEIVAALAHYGLGGLMPVEYVFQARKIMQEAAL